MKLFWGFTRMAFHQLAMYRLEFWMEIFGNIVRMAAAYWLWTTLYTQQPGAFPVTLDQIVTYGILALVINSFLDFAGDSQWYIQEKMRTGALQMDLLRPLDFHLHMLARNAGQTLFTILILGLPGYVIGLVLFGLRLPASLADGLLFLVSLLPAYLISFSLGFLLGMIAIYATQVGQMAWFYYSIVGLLSGQFIPLWIFPTALQQVVRLLPFQSMIGLPVSIYIGQFSLPQALSVLALQSAWAAVLLGLSRLMWGRAYAHLTLQGG